MTELGKITGAANDIIFTSQSYNITAFRGRDTAIRFVPSMSGRFGDDNVDIDEATKRSPAYRAPGG